MYLEKDYFLNELTEKIDNENDMYDFIRKSFPDVEGVAVKGSYIGFCLKFFSYACYPFSRPAVASVTGNLMGDTKIQGKLTKFQASGALGALKFKTYDMGARKAYYLLPDEISSFSSQLPSFMRNSVKLRRTGGTLPGHDYGVGLSILNLMLLKKPFEFAKEVNFSLKTYKKGKGSLCIDAIITFNGEPFTIYLEQDMGTEKMGELAGKLFLYHKHGLCTENGYVLFSSHDMQEFPQCLSFSQSDLKKLLAYMEEKGAPTLSAYYEKYYDTAPDDIRDTFRALAVRTGYLAAYHNNRRLDAAEIDRSTPLKVLDESGVFSTLELRRYIDELATGVNPYRLRVYNQRQNAKAIYKFRQISERLAYLVRAQAYDSGELRAVLDEGMSCLVYPTSLLSRSYSYISFANKNAVENVIAKYYPNFRSDTYRKLSPLVRLDAEHPSICLRNCYLLSDGTLLCVEHIGRDTGALVRFYYLWMFREYLQTSIHLVGLVENKGEIEYFQKLSGYYSYLPRIETGKSLFITFLSNYVTDKSRLLLPVGDDEDVEIMEIIESK